MDSSPPIPCRPNPKPRNSETGDPMRRSFRASPFPTDLSRKNPTGREISRIEFVDKENHNEKDQISNVVKVPKGAKNFMSPTISAVSKINPSPRKKILSDKNEVSRSFDKTHHHLQVRSCVSFSDVVSFIGEDKDQEKICIDEKKLFGEEESHDITVTDFDENHGNKSIGDFDDSSFKISPLPPSIPYTFPVFGSQEEVDPLVAPYDPKKNYLSPRPQFLHYRPNPRIELHSDECKQLEELFSSESSSTETDFSAEESQQEEEVASKKSVVAVEEEAEAEESQQVEEVASQEGVVAVEEEAELTQYEDEEGHLEAAESDEETEVVVGESTEEEEETHQVSKQSRFKAFKLLVWILVLGVAYSLVVSSVTLSVPNISQDSHLFKFHVPPEISKSARESFEQLSEKLGMWAGSSLVYMDKLISSLREEEGYGPFQFHNLTDILEDTRLSDTVFKPVSSEISVAGLLVDSQDWSFEMDTEHEPENGVHQEPEVPENSGEIDLEAVCEEGGNDIEQESEGGDANSEMVHEFDKQAEITMATDTEMNGGEGYSEFLSEAEESGGQETDSVEGQRDYEEIDQKNLEEVSESDTHHLNDVESAAISGHQQEETSASANPASVPGEAGTGDILETSLDISEESTDVDGNDLEEESGIGDEVVNAEGWKEILLNNQKKVTVLFSTVMLMLAAAAAAFLLAKKKANPVMMLHEDGEPTTISDIKEVHSEHVPVENLITERLSSLNFQEEEEEVNNDDRKREVSPFPSEMSFSFIKDKSLRSCSNKVDLKEYQSGGGGKKSNDSGESMASSASEYSIGSVSFGSFTTYEKIQKRSGRKEEEMVTPVRRSSRIRNHQHSGQ